MLFIGALISFASAGSTSEPNANPGTHVATSQRVANPVAYVATSQPNANPATHVMTIEGMSFTPQTLQVHRGDRIVWTNKDLFPHTATADAKAFDSGSIAANASWTFVASKVGAYSYGCAFHPTMKGKLVVL